MPRFNAGRHRSSRRLVYLLAFALVALDAGSTEAVEQHRVEINGFQFVPATIHVRPGDTITWVNRDIAPHTATSTDGSWDTGLLKQGESKTLTVTTDFVSDYFCVYHVNMRGTVRTLTTAGKRNEQSVVEDRN